MYEYVERDLDVEHHRMLKSEIHPDNDIILQTSALNENGNDTLFF